MTSLVEAGKISELREGTIKDILVNGREIEYVPGLIQYWPEINSKNK